MNVKELLKTHGCKINLRPKQNKIPIYSIPTTIEGAEEFNTYYRELLKYDFSPLQRTPHGEIKARQVFPALDVRLTNTTVEITVIDELYCLVIHFSTYYNWEEWRNHQVIGGQKAYNYLYPYFLKNYGIDLTTYKITNGEEVKSTIPSYLIKMEDNDLCDQIFENAHHIDFHSSFAGGWANTFPEFKEGLDKLYARRKTSDKDTSKRIKGVFNSIIGFFQSIKCCNASWAHISKAAITDNNNRIEDLAATLISSGRKVVAYNTDGIWYTGEIYHGSGEGEGLGQWENDHTNCKIRFKSAGSYEYIENGKCFPVVRGMTRLDRIKPRSEWEWGEIYSSDAEPIIFKFAVGDGIIWL